MKLSVTSWSFPACTLEEAAGLARLLGIGALDLGLFYRSALDREELLSDPLALAKKVQQLGVEIPNYHVYTFGGINTIRGWEFDSRRGKLEARVDFVVKNP